MTAASERRYDLVVMGAGAAGLAAAGFAARLGARVALVERDRIGGDCTWSGCIPSKTLLKSAKVAHQMRHAAEFGLTPAEAPVDFSQVMARVRATMERVAHFETAETLARGGIEVVAGQARFLEPRTVEVGDQRLRARRFVICTGAEPAVPAIPGLSATPHLTYLDLPELESLPARLLVLGGGPIGVEYAQAFQRLGSSVTLLEQVERIVPMIDPEASGALLDVLCREGVHVRTGVTVERVEPASPGVCAMGGEERWVGDALLVAVGRSPRVDELGLERAGVAHSPAGIVVDDRLRTSQRHIYACGDVAGGPQFAHAAAWQGVMAARNALLPGANYRLRAAVPWVLFTDPEIAQVGLSEGEARERRPDVEAHRWPAERVDRAQTESERVGLVKLVARRNGRLLGATVVAGAASELANELVLALQQRLTLRELAVTMHAYPTYGSGIQQASADAAMHGLAHGWRGRLLSLLARWWP